MHEMKCLNSEPCINCKARCFFIVSEIKLSLSAYIWVYILNNKNKLSLLKVELNLLSGGVFLYLTFV